MNSRLPDPNNHVPEVSPDDSWGDPERTGHEGAPGPTVLPARRTLVDQAPAAGPKDAGLRIEPHVTRVEPEDSPQKLEVLEISAAVVRLDPAIESPPRVERQFTFHEKPAKAHAGKKTGLLSVNLEFVQRYSKRWILVMSLTVGVLVISSLMLLPAINAPNAPREDSKQKILSVVDEAKVQGMEGLNWMLEQQPEALQIFRAYAQAAAYDQVLPMVKDGHHLKETLREHWQPLSLPKSWTPAADSSWAVIEIGRRPYGLMEVDLPAGPKFTAYFTNHDGHLVLDWKASTGFGTASFSQLSEGIGDGCEIRGEIENAVFHTAAWPEAEYRSYGLTSPDKETMIWCYARRNETADASIAPLLNRGEIVAESRSSRKLTLRLDRGPAGSKPNQWLIGEMLHIDWVTP